MKTLVLAIIIAYAIYTVTALTGYFAGLWTIEHYTEQLLELVSDVLSLFGAVMLVLIAWNAE